MGTFLVLILLASTSNLVLAQEYNAIFLSNGTITNDCEGLNPVENLSRVVVFLDNESDGRTSDDWPICCGVCIPEESMANWCDFYVEGDTGFVSPQFSAFLMGELPAFYLALSPWPDENIEWISPTFFLEPRAYEDPQSISLPFGSWLCSTTPLGRPACQSSPWWISVNNADPWPEPRDIRMCRGSGARVFIRDSLGIYTDYRLPCLQFRPSLFHLPTTIAFVDIDNVFEWTNSLGIPIETIGSGYTELTILDEPPCGTIDTFTVHRQGASVIVRWNTLSESNLSHFEIWRDHALGPMWLRHVADVPAVDSVYGAQYEIFDNDFFHAYLWYTIIQVSNDSLKYADMRAFLPWAPDAAEHPELLPVAPNLVGNYPNPFNATTLIEFELPVTSAVSLNIFDINGRWVSTLVDEIVTAGLHTITFDGSAFASGIYFARLTAGNYNTTHKMVLLK